MTKTKERIEFLRDSQKELQDLAYRAVLAELETTPKPGLVDLNNQGAHQDMDEQSFRRAALVLREFFAHVLELAYVRRKVSALDRQADFNALRVLARFWEERLLASTADVNTHKGMLFAFSLILYAIGEEIYSTEQGAKPSEKILRQKISELAAPSLDDYKLARKPLKEQEIADLPWTKNLPEKLKKRVEKKASFSEQLSQGHGLQQVLAGGKGGAREAACAGYPAIFELGLPKLNEALSYGFSQNTAQIWALLWLITELSDSNLYHRLGRSAGESLQAKLRLDLESFEELYRAENLSAEPLGTVRRLRRRREVELLAFVENLDREFIKLNASPGGSADQLALTIFFYYYLR